jgi:hypothetical protein
MVYTTSPLVLPHIPSPSRQNLVRPLVLWFCWRENTGDNMKDTVFLLVWDKDIYTKRFLVLLPCTYVLQPTLVCFYQTSSLLPGSLPTVASASLRLLYLLLCSERINHIQVCVLPLVCDPCLIILLHCFRSIICIWGRTCNIWLSEAG